MTAQRPSRRHILAASGVGLLASALHARAIADVTSMTRIWCFDRLDQIGGLTPHLEGHPQINNGPLGKAAVFNGVDDAVFLDEHPLAGAKTFSIEVVFRPDGGAFAQRWLHLAMDDATIGPDGKPLNTRMLFEIRVVGDQWYLDAFAKGQGYNQTLAFADKLFPLGHWYHVAQTYDGKTYRSFVNGALQGQADMDFKPQSSGHASVGTRINRVDYFKGAVAEARFTPQALEMSRDSIAQRWPGFATCFL